MRRWCSVILMVATMAGGCRKDPPPAAPRPHIVSLSPAITAVLFEMGLGEHVVGVTEYCVLPKGETREIVGDSQRINVEAVLAADADVVLVQGVGNAERAKSLETIREHRRREGNELRVEQFETGTLAYVRDVVRRLGAITGRKDLADKTLRRFEACLAAVRRSVAGLPRPRVLFVMDHRRPFAAREGTFLDELIEIAGGVNAGREIPGRRTWESATLESILAARPDVLICQSAPNEADAAREAWSSLEALPAAKAGRIHIVTDNRWTIPSTRLADRAEELRDILHPGAAARSEGKAKP